MPTTPYIHPMAKKLPTLECQGAAGQECGGVSPVSLALVVLGICITHCSMWVEVGRTHLIRFTSCLSVGFFLGKAKPTS